MAAELAADLSAPGSDTWAEALDGQRQRLLAEVGSRWSHLLPDSAALIGALLWLLLVQLMAWRLLSSFFFSPRSSEVLFFPDPSKKNIDRIRNLVDAARSKVLLAMFTLTDDSLSDAVLRAKRRGLDVRVIVDDSQADVPGSDATRLAQAGVPVVTDQHWARMHHKFAVIDREVLSGSFNWTKQASTANYENICILREPCIVKAFSKEFDALWHTFSGRAGRSAARAIRRPRSDTPLGRGGGA